MSKNDERTNDALLKFACQLSKNNLKIPQIRSFVDDICNRFYPKLYEENLPKKWVDDHRGKSGEIVKIMIGLSA